MKRRKESGRSARRALGPAIISRFGSSVAAMSLAGAACGSGDATLSEGEFLAAAEAACARAQHEVFAAQSSLAGEVYPPAFPSSSFEKYYESVVPVARELLRQMSDLRPPDSLVDSWAETTDAVAATIEWGRSAQIAVTRRSPAEYMALVEQSVPPSAPGSGPIPEICRGFSLGPGAGS
jgi:hypothetical protein